jgi:hypothetical protein
VSTTGLSAEAPAPNLKPSIPPWLAVAVPLIAVITSVAGAVWWAARLPAPDEFHKAQLDIVDVKASQQITKDRLDNLRDDVAAIKVDLRLLVQRRK